MQARELLQRIESKSAPVIVDPRSTVEFARGHIPGALNTPIWKLVLHRAQLPQDRTGEMVIACMHGQRAWLAKKLLALQGYRNTAFIEGWLQEWIRAGLPWDRPAS